MTGNEVTERDRHVQDAVRALMAEQGFHVSMEAVAARVGCSKQTLYNRYGSKQGLLQHVMQSHLELVSSPLNNAPDDDLPESLLAFAEAHLERLSDPANINAIQLLAAQAKQFPEETQTVYRECIDSTQKLLASWLESAMRQGRLRHDDPHYAAELLLSMIIGMDLERKRLCILGRNETQRRHWAKFAIDSFLRAFAFPPSHS